MSSLSRDVISQQGDDLISFERVATITQTSVTTIQCFIRLGVIEPEGSMLRQEDTLRVIKIMRLRRDLGLNLIGAAMVLELTEENHRLRSQLNALRQP
ncbi:chaperone modulator CbpM [Pleurocapsa sp. FMAR1]|uniref:chaperone modulator CbpM n=1 Tax=Pleurocapsa sp. FMAR1 TaxID=3040204 RepID=UPI0029C61AAB|nr:chaperone modulator CbpM [Pleurocapsa sp. FMAR1]